MSVGHPRIRLVPIYPTFSNNNTWPTKGWTTFLFMLFLRCETQLSETETENGMKIASDN